ncbi:M3 family metallopeptidase [Rhodoligotrophos appendicifer]|uniref:M3 family metallopeptidase n=1 Tax=Rhodoligotrophos appendicifer TaxID=987056 RepID=UPI0011869EB4|nr:M3 family metallopeptidase [Rhodoligotrophos appendicifer]
MPKLSKDDRNPLLSQDIGRLEIPPFKQIEPCHFPPAFQAALALHRDAIELISNQADAPSFANTIEAMERAGLPLRRICAIFFNLAGTDTDADIERIEREFSPILASHFSAIYLDERLFKRVETLHSKAEGLDTEQRRVLFHYHKNFVRGGGALPSEKKARLAEIVGKLASLGTRFGQNVLAEERAFALILSREDELAGLPPFLLAAASQAAADRGLSGKHVITLARSSIEPFLQFSTRRDLREAAFRAWSGRGEGGGDTDNRPIIVELAQLRAEKARLLGFESYADFRLDDSMAGKPKAALDLLDSVWRPAREQALAEAEALKSIISKEGGNFDLEPWDWRFYAEKRRRAEFDVQEDEIKPYLQLDRMIAAAFHTASRLFGLTFQPRDDLQLYHPDVRAWEVKSADNRHIGLFLGDYFARPSKRSGAWMSAFRTQHKLDGNVTPIILNVMNFSKPGANETALLSFDDARTLFHEFGHALHGLLSDVTYPSIAGTSVSRDFVEFPSQLFEHWLEQPELLREFAKHYITGEPMPELLLGKMLKARRFNQGFSTVEYCASALVDLSVHSIPDGIIEDVGAFETRVLADIGMPEGMTMRHRPTHFTHIFSGDGYASAYYSYLWSEVLDADGFEAFEEAGNIFDPDTAKLLLEHIYSAGGRQEPIDAYKAFRGREPKPEALLRQRGLE